MLRAVVVALAVSSSALVAQQQPLVGEWSVSYTAGMRIENGVATPMTATGTLAVVAQGDSLIGTLTMNPTGDMPARPPPASPRSRPMAPSPSPPAARRRSA